MILQSFPLCLPASGIFKSYDDIVDHCCDAWNALVDRPWKIMCIGLPPMGARVLINEMWY